MPDLLALRAEEFAWTAETIYLNHASIGPLPERTRAALATFNDQRCAPHQLTDSALQALLADARVEAARLVGADPDEIALATNTSHGLNLAATGLPLEPGDVVVLSDREFPANVYPWLRLRRRGISVELIPTTPEGWPDEARLIARAADPRVRVVAVSLVQFSNGYTVDLARLSAVTRAHDTLLVVDAIQGLGQVPVDLRQTPVDLLSCGGQKWLLSPWGSGFCYVRRDLQARLDPVVTGWMAFAGTDDFSRLTEYDPTLRDDARRYEMVTLPFQEFLGLTVSLRLLQQVGVPAIARHLQALHQPVREWAARHGVPITSPTGAHGSGILCLRPPHPPAAHEALRQAGIVTSLREGAIRLSPHGYNTLDEMVRVTEVLEAGLTASHPAHVRTTRA